MKPYLHARISAKKFGGIPEDYIEIHDWFDSTKAHIPDARHRLVLHNAYGIFLCEQVFGEIVQMPNGTFKRAPYITISTGKKVSVRDIAEQHVIDDLGCIPTLAACFDQAELSEEYAGNVKRRAVRLSAGTAVTIVD
jgi:hypothetical protein